MKDIPTFAQRLAPDTLNRLERAAEHRYVSGDVLWERKRRLAALYMYGFSAEISLTAAYFRCAGFSPNTEIDRDTRRRRMAQARLIEMPNGSRLMSGDPHPILGWARFVEYVRLANATAQDRQRLREAINKAAIIYRYWRPELRYKVADVTDEQLQQVQIAAKWLLGNHAQL